MRQSFKYAASLLVCLALTSCGGSSGGSSSSGGTPTPTPTVNAVGVNMGNISTIPIGNNPTNTSIIVTNNLSNFVLLQSATYTLYGSSGAQAPVSTSSANSPVNTSQCTTIQATGTCNVMVTVPVGATQGQYLITMNYLDPIANKSYTTSQVVSYSNVVPTGPNGIKISAINNSVYNQINGSTTMSIPFVLERDFSNLVASNIPHNPAFSPSINCSGSTYTAGTLCTLFIKISNTGTNSTLSGNVAVAESSINLFAMKMMPKKGIKGSTGYLFNVPVTVTQNNVGNLITSGVNVIVNPSTGAGANAQTITLLNNGGGSISSISVVGATPITVSSNTCSTLAAGASCTFLVNVNSTTSGQSSVAVTYNNGSTTKSLSFNVIYLAPAAGPAMTMTAGQGSLNDTVVGTTSYFNILVNNTGNVTLESITFNTNALPATMAWDSSSTCATDGTQSLTAGSSCTLVLSYTPTGATGSSSFTVREIATWLESGGNPQTYAAANLAVPYSAIAGAAFLYITPNYVGFAIRADGSDTAGQTFSVVNAGYTATTIDSLTAATPSVTAYGSTGGGTCATSLVLNPSESCTYITLFGPTTSTISTTAQMQVGYKPTSSESEVTAFANLAFTSSPAALITIESIAVANATGGTGLTGNPYTFTNSPAANTKIEFTVKYTNTGTESANNFNVALNTLPVGYSQGLLTTCATGSSVMNLLVNESCVVIYSAVLATGLYNPYALTGPLNVNIPGYSYTDNATGLNTNSSPTFGSYANTIYVTANSFATVAESAASWTTAGAGGTNTLTFTSSGGTPSGTTITIPSGQLQGFTLGGSGTCSTASTDGSCTITVTNPAGLPTGTIYFSYIVSPTNLISAGIIQQGTIVYTN